MSMLLTGGAGYIGSHTAVELISAGYEIVIADNFSNSSPVVPKRIEMITGKMPKVYNADVSDRSALGRIFEENKIEAVVHFAGYKAVGESTAVPLDYYRNNIDCAVSTLEVMKEYGVKRFIFSSSATVYGSEAKVPYKEDMKTGPCTSPYGWTKLFIEQIIRDYAASDKDFSGIILRYFNPVGAHKSGLIGEDPSGIPNNLMPYISKVAIGELPVLNVFGNDYATVDGTGVRDYIHVTDLAKGHISALEYSENRKGIEIFNLGTGRGISVFEMLHAYEKACGHEIPYRIAPRRPGDIAEYYADAEKANNVLKWKTESNLNDMCNDSWNWQRRNPKGYENE